MPPRAAAVAAGKNKQRKSSSPKVKADLDASATQLQRQLEQEKAWSEEATSMALFPAHRTFLLRCIKLRDAAWFQGGVIGVIFLAGILVAIQTYPIPPKSTATRVLHVLDQIVLWIFVIEIVVKLAAAGKKPWRFYADSWNVFDFTIVAVGFLPIGGGGAVTALRLIRLLRVLKLVKALPKLQILVIGLIKSMSAIGYIGALLALVFYLFAVLGMGFFGENDPVHLGELFLTMLSLFRAATLEDWTDIMYISMYGCEGYGYAGMEHLCVKSVPMGVWGAIYWFLFILISSMMILNLFIGVIASSMQDAQMEIGEDEAGDGDQAHKETISQRLSEISDIMRKAADELETFSRQTKRQPSVSSIVSSPTTSTYVSQPESKVERKTFPESSGEKLGEQKLD